MRAKRAAVALALIGLSVGFQAATSAMAGPGNHVRLETITVDNPLIAPPLKDACGVAVEEGGRVFVSNYYEHAIYVFGPVPAGGYELLTTVPVPEPPNAPDGKPFNGPCDLALDPSGDLYVNNWHANVVRFTPTAPGASSFAPGVVIDPGPSTGIAVDPADGRLFVDERTSVAEYEADPTAGAVPLRRIGVNSIADGYGVAISDFAGAPGFPATAGRVYVADAADGSVLAFDPATSLGSPVQKIDGEATLQGGFRDLADTDLAVDPRDGHIYVVDDLEPGFEHPEAVLEEFSSLGHYRGPVPTEVASGHPSGIIDAEPSAVAITQAGELFLTSGNDFEEDGGGQPGSAVAVFGPSTDDPTAILSVSKTGAGAGTVRSADQAGLRCGEACEGEFALDRPVDLAAEAAPHSRFAGWSGCPAVLLNGRCRVSLHADTTVGADFEPVPQVALTISVAGMGHGTVASAPAGIGCEASCAAGFDEGSAVTLTATPAPGSAFAGWSGCESQSGTGPCVVGMSAPRSVVADFEPLAIPAPPPLPPPPRHRLSVSIAGSAGAGGSVNGPSGVACSDACDLGSFDDGATATLEARPAAGSSFLGWGGCDTPEGARCTVSLDGDETVVAAFGPGPPGPLRLRGLEIHGGRATLRVAVPAPGEVSASSPRLRPVSALPVNAGIVALRLRLTAAATRVLARSHTHRLRVRVVLHFAPFNGGAAVEARRTVTFGAPKRPER